MAWPSTLATAVGSSLRLSLPETPQPTKAAARAMKRMRAGQVSAILRSVESMGTRVCVGRVVAGFEATGKTDAVL
jgi:hypothetical protein